MLFILWNISFDLFYFLNHVLVGYWQVFFFVFKFVGGIEFNAFYLFNLCFSDTHTCFPRMMRHLNITMHLLQGVLMRYALSCPIFFVFA